MNAQLVSGLLLRVRIKPGIVAKVILSIGVMRFLFGLKPKTAILP